MSDRFDAGECRDQILGRVRDQIALTPSHARGLAATWIIEEGLKSLAYTHGTRIAAEMAYRLADDLATAGSVWR